MQEKKYNEKKYINPAILKDIPFFTINRNRTVINKNIILMHYYNDIGVVTFCVAEVLNKKIGIYRLLKSNYKLCGMPFEEPNPNLPKSYYFDDIDRKDNICFALERYPDSSRLTRIYPVQAIFKKDFPENNNIVHANIFYGEKNKVFEVFLKDTYNIFNKSVSTVQNWLDFEEDLNKVYWRKRNFGKNYLQNDERLIYALKSKYGLLEK